MDTQYTALLLCLLPTLLSGTPLPFVRPPSGELHNPLPLTPSGVASSELAVRIGWPDSGMFFPNPFNNQDECNAPSGMSRNMWVCDPDKQIASNDVLKLSEKIKEMISNFKCQCRSPCSANHPMGRFSIGIAIAGNITGSGSDYDRAKKLSYNLRSNYWSNMKKCNDMIVIGLSTTGQAVYISPDPLAAVHLDSDCVSDILERTRADWESRDWYKALNETLDYVRNALKGGRCGTKTGLSVGQIIGIVCGVVVGVGLIIGLVVLCIGFFQNWECVAGTCLGLCIGCILMQIQACINAIIFSVVQSMLAECGCEDCCDCEPFDCIPADSADAGGGIEF